MKSQTPLTILSNPQGGVAFILVAVMVLALGMGAIILDLGRGWSTSEELNNIADSAAIAGAEVLGQIYTALPTQAQQNYNPGFTDTALIQNSARDATTQLMAGGMQFNNPGLLLQDIQIGQWAFPSGPFIPLAAPPNAVQVLARRDNVANAPLTTFFSGILNINGLPVTSISIAALTPLNYVPPATPTSNLPSGQLILPIAMDQASTALQGGCNPLGVTNLTLNNPLQDSCTSWHTFTNNSGDFQSDFDLITIANPPQINSPQVQANQTAFTMGGDPVIPLGNYYENFAAFILNNNLAQIDGNRNGPFLIPVYANNNCDDPAIGQQIQIVGFMSVDMTLLPGPAPDVPTIILFPECTLVSVGRSGNPNNFGTLGSVPVLVQ